MLNPCKTWTRSDLLSEGVRRLRSANVEAPRRNVMWMLEEVLSCSQSQILTYPNRTVPADQVRRLDALLERRCQHEPLQYILGHTVFYGLRLSVTPAVLIPRPETEEVVEKALHLLHSVDAPRFLDVGTGSGCIPLALKHERPDAEAHACDVSEAALEVAATNAEHHALDVHLFQADALQEGFPRRAPRNLDLFISNPPYIARDEGSSLSPEVYEHEPHRALFAGNDPLLFYRTLIQQAHRLLSPGGVLVFETHAQHGAAVAKLLTEANLADVRLQQDLSGRPRIATARKKSL